MSDSTASQPKKIHGIFAGIIDQVAVQRISNAISIASQQGIDEIHVMFQTTGGNVGDGVCLYNLFKAAPMEIVLYNAGVIASIGVIAYLGADQRFTTGNAAFMIHRTMYSPLAATVDRLQSAANAAIIDDKRIETIFSEHVKLSEEKWRVHQVADLWLSADDAIAAGLSTATGDFSPPLGEQIYYVGQT